MNKTSENLSFKHVARYLNIEMQDGFIIRIDLGNPTNETRTIKLENHNGISKTYLSDEF